MVALGEVQKLPSLLQPDDAGKVVTVNEAGNSYVLTSLGGSAGEVLELPSLTQPDDAGKVVTVDETGTSYILASVGGSAVPLNCEIDSISVCAPEGWAVTNAPISGARATVSKAAEVGVRHVVTAIAFNVITTTTAPTTATLTVTLRDGASGAGVALMTWRVRVSAAMTDTNVAQMLLTGLNIFGSDNTAMTLEFDAGDLNTLEDVSLSGYST